MKAPFAFLFLFFPVIAGWADTSITISNQYSLLAGQAAQSAYSDGTLISPEFSYDVILSTFPIFPPPPPNVIPGFGFVFNKRTSANITATLSDPTSLALPLQLPAGFSLICCQSNVPATFEMMVGRPPTEGTKIFRLLASGFPIQPLLQNDTNYAVYSFSGGSWSPEPPVAAIGEAVWIFQPPVISNLQVTNGTITFGALTGWGSPTAVEWSDSPTGPWQTLTNFPFAYGNVTNVVDSIAPDTTQRFYRLNVTETGHAIPAIQQR